ncbi:50S ribosomal protein L6 [bacterium]|nr:50S ribosomal protein L6 [bacterium]
MSRIGNSPINIPEGVTIQFENNMINAKGKLGELSQEINPAITLNIDENTITLSRKNDQKENRSMHGLYRALIYNMVHGVSVGYTKKLELIGVGYRAATNGQKLDFSVGFSHNIVFDIPQEIKVTAETEKGKAPVITLTSHDKQLLGAVASKIRSFRKPEPYKGKGIRYVDEYVRRKAGKTAAA